MAGATIRSSADWNDGDADRARGPAGGHRGQLGLGGLHAVEQRRGVAHEDAAGVGQADVAPGAFEQRRAGLALEHRELLGDRAGRVVERPRRAVDRPAGLELAQQAEAAEVEHPCMNATRSCAGMVDGRERSALAASSSWVRSSASSPPPPSAPWPSSASSPTTRGSSWATCCSCASRSRRRCCSPSRGRTGALRGLARRPVLAALAMGAVGYATQAGLYFAALERMDASLLALVLYAYPALVLVAAVAIGRERATARRVAALAVATAGTALVLLGAASGTLDPLGTVMGFGAALAYTGYILVGDRVVAGVPPVALAALVCTGATGTFAAAAAVTRRSGARLRGGGLGLARGDRARLDGRRDPRLLRRPRARRPVGGVDPLHARAGGHGRPRGGGVRRDARRGAAARRRARARRRWW